MPIRYPKAWPVLLLAALPVLGQIPLQFRYDRWQGPDRWEGIKDRHQASGELIEPISAIAFSGLHAAPTPDKLFAEFALSRPSGVILTVRLPDKNYWMEPADKDGRRVLEGKSGINRFSWDGKVVRYLNRTAQNLKAIAVTPGGTQGISIVPVLLYDSSQASQSATIDGYEFGFVPHGGEANVSYEVRSSPSGPPLASGHVEHRGEDEAFYIPWKVTGQAEGNYQLILHAEFPRRNQESLKPPPLILTFHHAQTMSMAN